MVFKEDCLVSGFDGVCCCGEFTGRGEVWFLFFWEWSAGGGAGVEVFGECLGLGGEGTTAR